MKWFKHDSNASLDAKLKRVRLKYGMEGYGLYWYCLELITGCVEAHNVTFELEHDAEIIADDTGINHELVQEMITYMVNLNLFEMNDGTITCFKLAKRLDSSMTSNPELRKIIKGFNDHHDSVMTISVDSHDSVMPEEKRREENRKGTKKFKPPTVNEVRDYCRERSNNVDPNTFVDHYEANGWMRGKSKIKDWKACVRTWEKNTKAQADPFAGAICD